MEYYRQKKDEIAKELNTDLKQGLSAKEAQEKLAQVGPNALVEGKKKSTFQVFLEQFNGDHPNYRGNNFCFYGQSGKYVGNYCCIDSECDFGYGTTC